MSILGIDIGSDTIKVVEMAKARGGYRLLNYGLTPTPPGSVVDGDVRDPEMVAEALRLLVKSTKMKSTGTASSVNGQKSTVIQIIELPRMDKKELGETMKFEVERKIPFAASQVIMDYAAIQRPGEALDSPNMEVLFAAVQEEIVNLHVDALFKARLKPRAIDVQPLAVSRALVETLPGRGIGETVAIVNIGATGTSLSIIRDGLLHFPRTIPVGGKNIIQRLSEGLGISEQQAERQLREHGSVRPLPPGALPLPVAEPEPVVVATPTDPMDMTLDVFGTDTSDGSDIGFGGTGTDQLGGFSFDDTATEAPVVERVDDEGDQGKPRIDISDDLDTEGSGELFDFGFSDDSETKHKLSPDSDPPEADEPVPAFNFGETDDADDEPAPAFNLAATDDPDDEPAAFTFELTDDSTEAGEPAAAAPEAPEPAAPAAAEPVAFDFEDEPETDEGATGIALELDETTEDPGAATAAAVAAEPGAELEPAEPVAFEFEDEPETDDGATGFAFELDETLEDPGAAAPPAVVAEAAAAPPGGESDLDDSADGGVAFDFGGETDSGPSAPAEGGMFDFDLGDSSAESSSSVSTPGTAPADTGGATDVGSSFDLGDLATQEGGLDFDLSELGDETAETGGVTFDVTGDTGGTGITTTAGPAAVGGDEAFQVRQVIEPVVREVAQEIARTLDYYRSRYEGSVVDRVVVVGGSARIDGLAEFLEEELGLPTDKGDPLAGMTIGNPRLTDEDLRRDAPVLAVAVGLALRELM